MIARAAGSMLLVYAALAVWIAALVHAARRRSWGWFAIVFFFPGLGMIAYWVSVAMADRPTG